MTAKQQQASEVHWRDVLRRTNADHLYAEDLGPVGTKVDVEVVDSGVGKVKGPRGGTDLPWLAFRGKRKRLGCNRTACKTLETICGTGDYTKWRGWITLVVIRTEYTDDETKQRMVTDAIRIAPQRPKGKVAGPSEKFEPPAQDAGATVTEDEAREIARAEAEGQR